MLMAWRQRMTPRKRLAAWLLLSALVHTVLIAPPSSPTSVTLQIPAPELAVAFATERRPPMESNAELPVLHRSPAVANTVAIESTQAASTSAAKSDEITNHLHALLHESLNRHFLYPPLAHRNGWEGRVELRVHLDHDGRLHAMRIVRSSGYPLLDQDALLTLQRIGSIPQARAWLPAQGYATTLPIVYRLTKG